MKATALASILAVLGLALAGYLAIQRHLEQESWSAESSRLQHQLALANRLADRHRTGGPDTEAAGQKQQSDQTSAAARLAEIETRILDEAARLAELESDRVVAEDRAEAAFLSLRKQVRSLAGIESDIAALGAKRSSLVKQIGSAERRLNSVGDVIAKREKRASGLDRQIADLVLRHETARARVDTAERALGDRNQRLAELETALVIKAAKTAAPKPQTIAAAPKPEPEPKPLPVVIDDDTDRNRSKGLYSFESLTVEADGSSRVDDASKLAELQPDGTAATADKAARSDAWAEDQYLMGLTLVSEGEQSSGTRELSEAVLAFKAVLGEWPRGRDPMRWAIARNDLGYALALLGQREHDIALLEDAKVACRDAMQEFKREETPVLWAAAQHHLGVTLSGLAAIRDDETLWRDAIEALDQAVQVFKEAGAEAEARRAARRLQDAEDKMAAKQRRS